MIYFIIYLVIGIAYGIYNALENVPKYLSIKEYKPDRSQVIAIWASSILFAAIVWPLSLGFKIYGRLKK
jgi:hypothetical protein